MRHPRPGRIFAGAATLGLLGIGAPALATSHGDDPCPNGDVIPAHALACGLDIDRCNLTGKRVEHGAANVIVPLRGHGTIAHFIGLDHAPERSYANDLTMSPGFATCNSSARLFGRGDTIGLQQLHG